MREVLVRADRRLSLRTKVASADDCDVDLEDIVVGVVSGIGRFLLWCWWVVPGPVGSPPYPSSRHRAVRWLQVIDYLLWRFFLAGLLIGVTVLILKLPG